MEGLICICILLFLTTLFLICFSVSGFMDYSRGYKVGFNYAKKHYTSWFRTSVHDPFKKGYYLVTIKDAAEPTILYYNKMSALWIDEDWNCYNVIAWMELPDAYTDEHGSE